MWAALWAFIAAAMTPFVRLLLFSLGFGSLTFVGLNALLSAAKNQMISLLSGLPSDILAILDLSGFFQALSIIFSAYATKLLVSGVNKATDTKSSIFRVSKGGVFGSGSGGS